MSKTTKPTDVRMAAGRALRVAERLSKGLTDRIHETRMALERRPRSKGSHPVAKAPTKKPRASAGAR